MTTLLSLIVTASAFSPPTEAWPADSLPLQIEVPQAACPLGTACLEAAQAAAEDWANVPCIRADAVVTGTQELGTFGDGVSQLLFSDPDELVGPYFPFLTEDSATERDLTTANGFDFIPHQDVLDLDCYREIDLLSWSTYAMGLMFRLNPPSPLGPPEVFEFWTLDFCNPRRAIIDPLPQSGVFTFDTGLEARCSPVDPNRGLVIGRAPFEVTCDARIVPSVNQLYVPYDDVQWDFGDGNTAQGLEVTHRFEEGGVFLVRASGIAEGESCLPVRGDDSVTVTLCPPVEPVLSTDEPRGLTIHLRNASTRGPAGCAVDASWTVHEGEDASGEVVATSTSWEPFLELPAPGTYTAFVTINSPDDGATAQDQITFEVRRECSCASSPSTTGWWALGLVAMGLIRRRRR